MGLVYNRLISVWNRLIYSVWFITFIWKTLRSNRSKSNIPEGNFPEQRKTKCNQLNNFIHFKNESLFIDATEYWEKWWDDCEFENQSEKQSYQLKMNQLNQLGISLVRDRFLLLISNLKNLQYRKTHKLSSLELTDGWYDMDD